MFACIVHAHLDMTVIPDAHYNILLIALPLNCVINPCQVANISSRVVDLHLVTTITV